MKKTFEQPELNVIFINNNINTISVSNTPMSGISGDAPDRFRDFEDYSY